MIIDVKFKLCYKIIKTYNMKKLWVQLIISATMLSVCVDGTAQIAIDTSKTILEIVDSLKREGLIKHEAPEKPDIKFTINQAIEFLEKQSQPHFWRNIDDPLRKAIEQLVFLATNPTYNSLEEFLKNYEYDSIKIPWEAFYIWDTLKLKILDTEPESFLPADTVRIETDTINAVAESDSTAVFPREFYDIFSEQERLKDTSILITTDMQTGVNISDSDLPFIYYSNPFQVDSLEIAVNSLIKYLEDRDSTIIHFGGRGNVFVPIWLNSKSDNMTRYWLKNDVNDSVTVWIGSIGRNAVGLFTEQGVTFIRQMNPTVNNTEARVNVERQNRLNLLEVQRVAVKKRLWRYRTESNIAFNQTGLWNWVKGGEGSLSSLLDLTSYADYNNRDKKFSSNNFVRLKLGFIASGENPMKNIRDNIRKNTDILEASLKLNHKAFGKFDFSAVALFKTQLLKGYTYPKDADPVLVSQLLNPANMTVGLGLDYKPNAQTSINFSPLSYKLTFLTDTANFDQTKYGIPKDKKAMHEPGMNFMFSNTWKPPEKNFSLTNRLQLFTNYIDKPQNIDVDWELTLATKLSWNADLRINTHLIFSDNIKTKVLDKDKKPVLNDDGTEKKTARIQFKEMVGLSLVFRF